ncbi:MAG: hypothetical protein ACK4VO_10595 [Pseudobdellovibrio sp.]
MTQKLFITLAITFMCLNVFAVATDTTDITIEGMHCSGCKKMITKTVCEDKDLSANFESCSVSLVDTKKQIGKITVKTKDGKAIDYTKIETAVKKAGDDYKVVKPEQK